VCLLYTRSSYGTNAGVTREQPIPFSHQHHVGVLGIDCRYCHTTVEKSSYAGLPSTETCMSCHSQIWTNSPMLEPVRQSYETNTPIQWNLVNKVPQFIFFNHSIHIARGLNCNICHGPVNEMQITWKGNSFQMAWCLQCHRAPERYLSENKHADSDSPRQQVFNSYWDLQEKGYKGVPVNERDLLRGEFTGSDDPEDLERGRELVKKYNIHVQQLADCGVCHH